MKIRCLRCALFALLALGTLYELVSVYRSAKDEMVSLTYRGRQELSGKMR